ncbi:hypothetical protein ASE69_18090 [Sphingomonas sp. Leaf208]|nr:hypothetical protein ASE69_18090 [Sphingomonas sp. Leaf208]
MAAIVSSDGFPLAFVTSDMYDIDTLAFAAKSAFLMPRMARWRMMLMQRIFLCITAMTLPLDTQNFSG